MQNIEFIKICLAFALTLYVTFLLIRDLRKGSDSFLRKVGRWIKNVIDVFFGIG